MRICGDVSFISLLGGAAAAWPLAAHAQQERMRRIGVLMGILPTSRGSGPHRGVPAKATTVGVDVDGRNVQIDTRWGAGDADRLRTFAAKLVAGTRRHPGVLAVQRGAVATGDPHRPIVFTQTPDPVGAGYVEGLRGRAATPPVHSDPNTALVRNGWSVLKRSRQA